jgi:hypothetical protein
MEEKRPLPFTKPSANRVALDPNRTIAKLWKRTDGHECLVHKCGNEWLVTLTLDGRVIREATIESPGEALRLSEEWFRALTSAG